MGIISRTFDAIARVHNFDPERAYLEAATSRVDLERRQRELDAGKFRRQRRWPY